MYVNVGVPGMIRFHQSWSGPCLRMKDDWELLAKTVQTKTNKNVFIADFDCGKNDKHKDICHELGITNNYPIIQWYDSYGKGHDYTIGAKGYNDLYEFVMQQVRQKCIIVSSSTITCSEKEIKYMTKWKPKTKSQIKKEIQRLQSMKDNEQELKLDIRMWILDRIDILRQVSLTSKDTEGSIDAKSEF